MGNVNVREPPGPTPTNRELRELEELLGFLSKGVLP